MCFARLAHKMPIRVRMVKTNRVDTRCSERLSRADGHVRRQRRQTMTKANELRDMSDEQLAADARRTRSSNLFRLRLQAQTERLDAPASCGKHRRLIARDQDDSEPAATTKAAAAACRQLEAAV